MRIYVAVWHIPYTHNLAMAFPEHTFLTPGWDNRIREQPPNLEVVTEEFHDSVDVVIDSLRSFKTFEMPCRVKVKLLHMECGANTPEDDIHIQDCIQKADAVVSVSEHKMWTFGHVANHPKIVTIPFGLVPLPMGRPVHGVVGTLYSDMSEQQAIIWRHVLEHFPDAELTGYRNPFNGVEPKSYQEFDERFSRMDVFVHTVVGNSVGLSFAEAMLRGIPVVTGMNTDLPKELVSGRNCIITTGNAHQSLDEMVMYTKLLIGDRMMRMRIGHAARQVAKKLWGLDALRRNWTHVFNGELEKIS